MNCTGKADKIAGPLTQENSTTSGGFRMAGKKRFMKAAKTGGKTPKGGRRTSENDRPENERRQVLGTKQARSETRKTQRQRALLPEKRLKAPFICPRSVNCMKAAAVLTRRQRVKG